MSFAIFRVIASCLIALSAAAPASAQENLKGIVVSVTDRDPLTVLDDSRTQHKIRLAGIDAPERVQAFGQKSKDTLSTIAFNRYVEVVGEKKDRYGRIIGKVMVADPNCHARECPRIHDSGPLQVMSGMAWWYRKYANEQSTKDREDYEIAEFKAKATRRGLWAETNPVPPGITGGHANRCDAHVAHVIVS